MALNNVDAPLPDSMNMDQTNGLPTGTERMAHYRELAAQFLEWAKSETNEEARVGLLDMACQYERLASDLTARIDAVLAKRD